MNELSYHLQALFGISDAEDLQKIQSAFVEVSIHRGDFLLQASQRCTKLSFVKSGLLRVFASTDKTEVTQWISAPGSFSLDLASFVFNRPARWNIQALTNVELFIQNKENYENLHHTVPNWSQWEKQFIVKCFTALEDRIFSHLSLTSEERYQQLFQYNPELFNAVPLQFIASMLGMTPETLSRIRKKQLG